MTLIQSQSQFINIYAQNDQGFVSLYQLEEGNTYQWQVNLNENQANLEQQSMTLNFPKEFEQVSQIGYLDKSGQVLKLSITKDRTQFENQWQRYFDYLTSKETYQIEVEAYQVYLNQLEAYQSAVSQYEAEVAAYEQAVADYQWAVESYYQQLAQANQVLETEEGVPVEVTEAPVPPVEPVAPTWDETIQPPQEMSVPVDPYDAAKEDLWKIIYQVEGQESYQLVLPAAVPTIQLYVQTNQIASSGNYKVVASNTVTQNQASATYEAAVERVLEDPTTTETTNETTAEKTSQPTTSTIQSETSQAENSQAETSETEAMSSSETSSATQDQELYSSVSLSQSDLTVQLYTQLEVSQDQWPIPRDLIYNLSELPDTLDFQWLVEPDTSQLGQQSGQLKIIQDNGIEDIFDVSVTVIESANLSLSRMFSTMNLLAERAPKNVNNMVLLTSGSLTPRIEMEGKGNNEVWLTSGDSVVFKGDYVFEDGIIPGDTFVLDYGPYLQPGGLNEPRSAPDIRASNGVVIAKAGPFENGKVTYTFTDFVAEFTEISGSFEMVMTEYYPNHPGDKKPVDVKVQFGSSPVTNTLAFDYGHNEKSPNQISTTKIDTTTQPHTFTSIVYINQARHKLTASCGLGIYPIIDITYSGFNAATDVITFYKVPTEYVLPQNFRPDYSNWEKVSLSETKIENGSSFTFTRKAKMAARERYIAVIEHQPDGTKTDQLKVTSTLKNYRDNTINSGCTSIEASANYFVFSGSGTGGGTRYAPLSVRKLSSNNNLIKYSNATFTLYADNNDGSYYHKPGNIITSVTTLAGVARIDEKLAENKAYWFEETQAPDGYTKSNIIYKIQVLADPNNNNALYFLIDTFEKTLDASGNPVYTYKRTSKQDPATFTFDMINQPTGIDLDFTKKDSDSDQPLAGVTFTLTKTSESEPKPITVISDKDGKILFEGLLAGSYSLAETPLPGYKNPGTMTFDVVEDPTNGQYIIQNQVNNLINEENAVNNKKLSTSLEFYKRDKATNKYLENVSFTLTKKEDVNFSKEISSDISGLVVFKDLTAGTYILSEQRPAGYKPIDPIEIIIRANADNSDLEIVSPESLVDLNGKKALHNSPLSFDLEFNKVQKLSETETRPLAEAEFTLTKYTDSTRKTVDTGFGDQGLLKVTSAEDGKISFPNLALGSYQLVESRAPEGYQKLETKMTFDLVEVRDETTGYQLVMTNIDNDLRDANNQVVNETMKMDLSVTKISGTDTNLKLEGASFKVKSFGDSVQPAYSKEFTSNESGLFTITDLTVGKYQITETKAPDGYQILDQPMIIEVLVNPETGQLEIKLVQGNTAFIELISDTSQSSLLIKNYQEHEFPNTGGLGSAPYILMGILVLLVTAYIYWHQNYLLKEERS